MKYFLFLYYFLIFLTASVNAQNNFEPLTLDECYADTDRALVTAGKYIVKEATSQRLIKDLKVIINDKDAEIALLRSKIDDR